jgi:integrase
VEGADLRGWFYRHEIRPFLLKEIRSAMATIVYEDTGDIMAVKEYLHHESLATTILYLAEYAVLPRAEQDVAEALDSIARKAGLL